MNRRVAMHKSSQSQDSVHASKFVGINLECGSALMRWIAMTLLESIRGLNLSPISVLSASRRRYVRARTADTQVCGFFCPAPSWYMQYRTPDAVMFRNGELELSVYVAHPHLKAMRLNQS